MLLHYVLESADHGFPLAHRNICQLANVLITSQDAGETQGIGINWVDKYIERYWDQLQPHWSKPLDTAWACALNPTVC